jgi:flavorubredoxin
MKNAYFYKRTAHYIVPVEVRRDVYTKDNLIADGIFRLTLAPNSHFEFSQFLLLDKKTCLVHAGKETHFEVLKDLVKKKLGDRSLDYIVFSHVEADESGAVNHWLKAYPEAKVICNKVANINLADFLIRPAQILNDGDELVLGERSLRLINTPHFPHNWDAHMWFETSNQILFSSDFCCQGGICEPIVEKDLSAVIIDFYVKGGFIPYGKTTNENVEKLSALSIKMMAPMHGSIIAGDAARIVFEKVKADLISWSQLSTMRVEHTRRVSDEYRFKSESFS